MEIRALLDGMDRDDFWADFRVEAADFAAQHGLTTFGTRATRPTSR